MPDNPFNTIEEAVADLRAGKMIVLVDDEDRENEGDFVMAAEHITADAITLMTRHASGIITVPMPEERLLALQSGPDGAREQRVHAHGVHDHRGCQRRHDDGQQRRRPRADHPPAGRPRCQALSTSTGPVTSTR